MLPGHSSIRRLYTRAARRRIVLAIAFFATIPVTASSVLLPGCSNQGKADPSLPPVATSSDGHAATRLQVAGGTIDLLISGTSESVTTGQLIDWTTNSAKALSNYFGRFPVRYAKIEVTIGGPGRIDEGVTDDNGIRIRVGSRSRPRDLQNDWVLVHEMFHLAFPDMDDEYIWLREGLASYLEPLARARIGTLSTDDVWQQLIEGLPQGEPEPGDRGLDVTHTWGRTYWGGSLFCLLLDLRIREQTHNRKSIDDAMRAILDDGGNRFAHWSMDRVIAVSDKATGTHAFRELYQQMSRAPVTINLSALWKKLGVRERDGRVTFNSGSPDAAIRTAMTSPQ